MGERGVYFFVFLRYEKTGHAYNLTMAENTVSDVCHIVNFQRFRTYIRPRIRKENADH